MILALGGGGAHYVEGLVFQSVVLKSPFFQVSLDSLKSSYP
jgi:hypothetical protein